ncbi:uncharacterized protein LOC142331748 [Lycorma delicatula]|uniref:uncharacterized protein LOC142331748 n=1 Tax=Lycorma delicatula TaxID=130591 RepID=UPI003F518D38
MTSFGRGRGILGSRQTVSGPVPNIKCFPVTKRNSLENTVTSSPVPLILDNCESSPNLHQFGEKLISLSDKDSLFKLISDIINDSNCTVDIVDKMVQIIINRSMWFPTLWKKYASLLDFLSSHKFFGENIKKCTLTALQEFYDDRDTLRVSKKYGERTFQNAVILTGEIYYRFRPEKLVRFRFFAKPMITYLKMLVNSSDENDILIIAQQISWNASHMKSVDENTMNELILDIRHSIISNSFCRTEKCNCLLLLCIELLNLPFENFSENIKEFYHKILGKEILQTVIPPPLDMDDDDLKHYNIIRKFFA